MGEPFAISNLSSGNGVIGISRLPGLHGDLQADIDNVIRWQPNLVVSMTEWKEMEQAGSHSMKNILNINGIEWFHLPIRDYGAPSGASAEAWPRLSATIHRSLDNSGRVLLHCRGGHGRSGMIALRLLVERGELPDIALMRLRAARPGAIETREQADWASLSARQDGSTI